MAGPFARSSAARNGWTGSRAGQRTWPHLTSMPLRHQSAGGTKHATSANVPLLRPRSSEGKFAAYHEVEPVRRSLRRLGSGTSTEVARLAPSDGINTDTGRPAYGSEGGADPLLAVVCPHVANNNTHNHSSSDNTNANA